MADSSGYDPRRSRVSDDKMNEFLRGQLTGDLTEVPGIGPAAVKKLALGDLDDDKVTNTFQLIGKVSPSAKIFISNSNTCFLRPFRSRCRSRCEYQYFSTTHCLHLS